LPNVLVVEDNASDVFLIREAIENARFPVALHVLNDGETAVRFFDHVDEDITTPCPELVILDVNLPKIQGGEVLKHLRQSRRCRHAIVVVVSTSESASDREQMESLGANRYFRKPSDYEQFMHLGNIVKTLLITGSPQ
jgi:two-component system, chemotaxis family, response regulator Rcp1